MARLEWMCLLSFLVSTTQLAMQRGPDEGEDSATDLDASVARGIMDFGGIFDLITDAHSKEAGLIGSKLDNIAEWPKGSWKAPLGTGEDYPGSRKWPVPETTQCTAADMKEINFWAIKQAKQRLPTEGYNGTFATGTCHKNNYGGKWQGLAVRPWAKCYQKFYNVSTGCAQCIGSVYNMAIYNWSEPCYNFCYGRPNRRDGSHWCWEDCQSCMWFIGRKLSTCYGEPYDMVCRYAKELGREDWFEKNGIEVKR